MYVGYIMGIKILTKSFSYCFHIVVSFQYMGFVLLLFVLRRNTSLKEWDIVCYCDFWNLQL